jgi:signal transduction histidine kinase
MEFVDDALQTVQARGRRATGILLMAGIGALQLASEYIGVRDATRIACKAFALSLGLPVVIGCSFALFRWSSRRSLPLLVPLATGLVASGTFFATLLLAVRALVLWLVPLRAGMTRYDQGDILRVGFMMGMTYFALWALVFLLPAFAEHARTRRLEADKLRTLAELAQLRSNLEPHFLLNTLNTVAGLVTEDPRQARRLLGNLGDLLRDSTGAGTEMETIDAQIEWLRRYAQILETRHAGQLAFRWDIGDATPRVLLPRLLLQPLVENAVKHGALKRGSGGEITVRTQLDGSRLVCTVEDNGPGVSKAPTRPGAFGILSVRRRLAVQYADAGSLRVESTTAGTRWTVEVPVELAAAS